METKLEQNSFYNPEVLKIIKDTPKEKKKFLVGEMEYLGKGIWGKTYTSYLKKCPDFPIVVKKLKRGTHTINEMEALIYLRNQMLEDKLPHYYNFLYGVYSRDDFQYFILEKVDEMLVDVMELNNWETYWYKNVYGQIIDAVSYLEKLNFNHGDLWDGNIMVNWIKDVEFPQIVFIDWDSAYMTGSQFTRPTQGGGFEKRHRFILGYDLNRYFDSVIYCYNSYCKKKDKLINKLTRRKEDLENHPELEDIDEINIIYPDEIIDFFSNRLNCVDIDEVDDNSNLDHMRAENVKEKLDCL